MGVSGGHRSLQCTTESWSYAGFLLCYRAWCSLSEAPCVVIGSLSLILNSVHPWLVLEPQAFLLLLLLFFSFPSSTSALRTSSSIGPFMAWSVPTYLSS